jgi:hypothetical protein
MAFTYSDITSPIFIQRYIPLFHYFSPHEPTTQFISRFAIYQSNTAHRTKLQKIALEPFVAGFATII